MAIYSEFSHKKWQFLIAMLNYRRLQPFLGHCFELGSNVWSQASASLGAILLMQDCRAIATMGLFWGVFLHRRGIKYSK